MAHRPRASSVILTRYTNKPEQLDYFLTEMEDIRGGDPVQTQAVEEEEVEEGIEQEEDAKWLKKAGFENIVYILENTQGEDEVTELESKTAGLPKAHAAMIRQRMHTLRSTIRSKHVQRKGADVRHLFTSRTKESIADTDSTVQLLSVEPHLSASDTQTTSTTITEANTSSINSITTAATITEANVSTTSSISAISTTSSISVISTTSSISAISTTSSISATITTKSLTPQFLKVQSSSSLTETDSSQVTTPPHRPLTPPPNPTHLSPNISMTTGQRGSLPNIQISPNSNKRFNNKPNGIHKSPSPDSTHTQNTDIKLSFCLPTLSQVSESLPTISLDPDPLGITMIDDLSLGDMQKIQCLAHIELTITFDENNIPLRTLRTPKLKNFEEKQFGVPLTNLLQNDQRRQSKADIPLIFKEMVEFLETDGLLEEGILRVSGSKHRIKEIQEEIESKFNLGTFSFEGRKPADVAALLKQFLRELPIPLLTREHLPAFASIADISELKEQVRTLNLLILMLPPLHQRILKHLLQFCEKIHKERENNKMDITNIAMVLAPNLFCSLPAGKLGCDDVTLAAKTSHVVLLLIRYHYILWTVPSGMITQVRFLYEFELKKVNERYIRQALQKMNHSDSSSKKPENSNHIIRVKAPLFTCVSKAVNIQEYPTAGTVVAKLRKRSHLNIDVIRRFSSNSLGDSSCHSDDSLDECSEDDIGEQFLYEVGGNIGERRLDSSTNMIALYEVNPAAEWIIKPRVYPPQI